MTNYTRVLSSEGFSNENVWINLGASFAQNGSFGAQYGSSTRDQFIDSVYHAIFGYDPASDAHSYLKSVMDYFVGYTGTELGSRGAIAGFLLELNANNASSSYAQSATHFLEDAAVATPAYEVPLIGVYLHAPTHVA